MLVILSLLATAKQVPQTIFFDDCWFCCFLRAVLGFLFCLSGDALDLSFYEERPSNEVMLFFHLRVFGFLSKCPMALLICY